MPGLKELESFRNELSNLGHEREVAASRGETYEELPLPSAIPSTAPQINVDDLLASLGAVSPDSGDVVLPDEAPPARPSGVSPAPSSPPPAPATPKQPSADANPFANLFAPGASGGENDPFANFGLPEFGSGEHAEPAASAPESFEIPGAAGGETSGGFDMPSDFDLPAAPSATESSGTSDSGDFGNFDDLLASLPLDDSSGTPPEVSPSGESIPALDDAFAVPEDLLANFAEDIEKSQTESDSFSLPDLDAAMSFESSADSAEPGAPSVLELSPEENELGDLQSVPEAESVSDLPSGAFDLPSDFDIPAGTGDSGDSSGFDISSDFPLPADGDASLPEMDFTPSFEMDTPPEAGPSGASDEISLDDLSMALDSFAPVPGPAAEPLDEQSAPNPFGEGFENFSIPDGLAVSEEPPSGGAAPAEADGFDGFSLDEDFLKTGLDSTAGIGDDFHIPGFSDFTSGAARAGVSELPSGGGKPQKKEIPLQISDADFNKFLSILASYPLNLKIAAEEFLAGDVGTEVQKMEFVHHVIERTSVRKLAHSLEGYLNRFIPIPKDYEKKTVEEYEREKSSLKYVFMNRILPAAILFTIVAVLSFCTVYLSYQFIYRPLAAESLYARGYAAIEDGRYTQSLELFDQAVRKWDKKPWYFKYARAFRAKKQFANAELMYTRILDRFKNDKAGGLEYAEMLRTELRNFEKAETILKRRLLDNFVNDKDCLMLLGDTYLDWAEEEPEKYEDARHTYASLIELYGPQDPFLARMMRYFIRTNNLKEVLPLKEHFTDKRAKIGAPDLVELSQYLLEKRYMPSPGDSQQLIDKIEDVRTLLERAVDSDGTSPEAHYNIGRFYIYNYKNMQAANALTEALKQFEKASSMSPKRVMAHVDAYRLLGEICRDDGEFLKAQGYYGDGITLYETQRENRSVRPDPRVGVLYADFADIDYFISNDLDGALYNYRKSIDELNDTPSVRYRVGYIMYQKQDYEAAMDAFSRSHSEMPDDRNVLYGYGNTLVRRGDYYAAQGYYERLMDLLEAERLRKGIVLPQARVDHGSFVEEYMRTANNLGVILDHLARRTGDSRKKARALDLFAESGRAWDTLTRNPETMVRAQGANLSYLNIQTVTHPRSGYESEIFADIPRTLEGEKVLQQLSDQ